MNELKNTDKEIWREIEGEYYSPSIFVTEQGKIGINVGGVVYVQSVEKWHQQADRIVELEKEVLMWENAEVPTEVMADTIQELERRGFITTPQIKELSDEEIERIYYKTLNRFDFARAILKKASEK